MLYDLVYVAAISQAAATMATEISVRTVAQFALIFALIWIAWSNGSLWLEIHGREDGRTRSYVFIQIGILAMLAVFAANAFTTDGQAFALVYASFLAVMTWLWQSVRYQDTQEFQSITRRYVLVMLAETIVIAASAFLPADQRIVVWAIAAVAFLGFWGLLGASGSFGRGVIPTHSMAERFGLFTIIVLGEVVIGVVVGLSETPHDAITLVTGILALGIGLGFWWIYFDIIGNRVPRHTSRSIVGWTLMHLPITLAIAATGAGMVSLLEHANDAETPERIAWLISGAVALTMLSTIAAAWALVVFDRLADVYRRLAVVMVVASVAALMVGWFVPPPPLLVAALAAILTITWLVCVRVFLQADAWPPNELEALEDAAAEG